MATLVTVDPRETSVEPGLEAVCGVRIRNDGPVVDEFTAEVVGEIVDWAVFEADSVRLFPGDEGTLRLHLRPPRTHRLIPGAIPFGVRVTATSIGERSAVVEEGTVRITPFHEVEAAITPRRSRARISARHRVTVTNRGNVATAVKLTASDPDDVLEVRFRKPAFELAPGAHRRVRTRVWPATLTLTPGPEPHQFDVKVEPEEGPPIPLQAAMVVRSVVPIWVPIALAVMVAIVVILVGLLRKESVQTLATQGSLAGASPTAAPAAKAGSAAGGAGGAGGAAAGGAGAGAVAAASGSSTSASTGAPLTATEAACLSGAPIGEGSSYPADGTAQDAGPNHQDGTPQGATTYGPGAGGAGTDQAFVLPGGVSAVDLGPKVGQLGTSGLCVALVMNTTQKAQQALIGNRTSAAAGGTSWDLRMQPSGQPYAELGPITVTGYTTVNDGKWHRLCLIRSDTLINLYVDGRLSGTTNTSPAATISSGGDTHLGWDGLLPYTGSLDDIVIVQG